MSIRTRCKVCRKLRKTNPEISQDHCTSHKERRYQALVWDGQQRLTRVCTTSAEAKAWEAETLKKIKSGVYRKIEPVRFKDYVAKYLATKTHVRPAVYTHYLYVVKFIESALGNYRLTEIDAELVDEVIKTVAHREFYLRQKLKFHLQGIFKGAMARGFISRDPTAHLAPVKRERPVVYYILDNKMIKALLTLPEEVLPKSLKLYYMMLIYLGLRPEELVGLPVHNINMEAAEVKIDQALYWLKTPDERAKYPGKQYLITNLKTVASYRTLPIGKNLLKEIQLYLMDGFRENKLNLLFTSQTATPVNYDNIRKRYWYKHRAAASLPPLDMYHFRHTFCSILVAQGHDLMKIKELMGHSDIKTTTAIYTHVMKKNNSHIADSFEKYVNSESQESHKYTANNGEQVKPTENNSANVL